MNKIIRTILNWLNGTSEKEILKQKKEYEEAALRKPYDETKKDLAPKWHTLFP